MIIVDIETTGLNFIKNGIASIGAVELEHPEREFYGECRIEDDVEVSDDALKINGYTTADLYDPSKQSEQELIEQFFEWAMGAEEHTVGAQNPAFDVGFLQSTAMKHHVNFPLAHRSFDMHSMCYLHMVQRGESPPVKKGRSALNSDAIMRYVGIPEEPKPHIAINGAKYEAEAFSRLLHGKTLLNEFASYPIPWQDSKSRKS